MLATIAKARGVLQDRFDQLDPEGGYSTETVVVTAALAAVAIAVLAIIVAKIMAKGRSITLN
ncbi:MAG: hypothetical protein HYX34_05335 [Actinobacteria bacterium]|nr:hypothetical protein [Actinomycetota bacterium]